MFMRFRFLFFLLILLLTGCGGGIVAPDWDRSREPLAWPSSEVMPRIEFLRTFSGPQDYIADKGQQASFLSRLTGGEAERLPLVGPNDVAADGAGRIWVSDQSTSLVYFFDLSRHTVDYLPAAGETKLLSPVGVAFDAQRDRLYVSDSVLNRVFMFSGKGEYQGELRAGQLFDRPGGMDVDAAGNLYVTEVLGGRVLVFDPQGVQIREIRRQAPPHEEFNRPLAVRVDRQGRVYVLDSMNFQVEIFSPQGQSLGTVGEIGLGPGYLARPKGMAVDSTGNIYISDANVDVVQIFDHEGQLLLYFGESGEKSAQFNLPSAMAFDAQDRLYVVDTYNMRIQLFRYIKDLGGR